MTRLEIRDHSSRHPSVFLELRDFLPVLAERGDQSEWEISMYEELGIYPYFEAVGCERMWELEESRARFSYTELEALAAEVRQVIWGSFKAFDNGASAPWLILSAYDSSYWLVDTEHRPTQQAMFRCFSDVRERQP